MKKRILAVGLSIICSVCTVSYQTDAEEIEDGRVESDIIDEASEIREEQADDFLPKLEPEGEESVESVSENDILSDDIRENEETLFQDTIQKEIEDDFIMAESGSNDIASAYNISVNESYYHDMTFAYEDNYYKFSINQPGIVNISFSHPIYSSDSSGWEIQILSADQKVLLYTYSSDGYTESITSENVGLERGSYYVYVRGADYDANKYRYYMKVNYTQSNVWEKEINDDWLQANPVATNTWYYGSTTRYEDDDYYSFSIAKPGVVQLRFYHNKFASTQSGWEILLYTSDHKQLYDMYSSDGYTESVITLPIGLPAGNYYALVEEKDVGDRSPYRFYISYESRDDYEREFNDDRITADPIFLDKTIHGSLNPGDQTDNYKFSVTSNTKLQIQMTQNNYGTSYSGWKIEIWDSADSYIESYSMKDGKTASGTTETFALRPGNYYAVAHYTMSWPYAEPISYSFTLRTVTNPDRVSLNTPKNRKKRKLYLSWKADSFSKGYEVQIAQNKKFTKKKKTIKVSGTNHTFKKLKKNKIYYARVRGYAINQYGQKSYGPWSKIKKVKIKK